MLSPPRSPAGHTCAAALRPSPLLNLQEEGVSPFHLQLVDGPEDVQRGTERVMRHLEATGGSTGETGLKRDKRVIFSSYHRV